MWNLLKVALVVGMVCSPGAQSEDTILQNLSRDELSATTDFLKQAGLDGPRPPVILIPGVIASRLIAWKQKKCSASTIDVQDVVWMNLKHLMEAITYDKHCWLDCLKLNKNGTDPPDCKLRTDEGLGAIGELSPGAVYKPSQSTVFTPLIRAMAMELGYDANNIIGAPYDWRLAPTQMEARDSYFTTLKFKIETAVKRHGRPAVVLAYSMGNNLFMYFVDWLRLEGNAPPGGCERWLRQNVWGYVGYAAPLLGSATSVKSVLSGHTCGLPISEAQARELLLTCTSSHFINPRSAPHASHHSMTHFEPLVTVRGLAEKSVADADSQDLNMTTTTSVRFNVSEVESGRLFEYLGRRYPDSQMQDKVAHLDAFYRNDPLLPLSRPFVRPPIKHVLMIYGVDMPTQVGYTYQVQQPPTAAAAAAAALVDNTTSVASDSHAHHGPNPLLLTETYFEEAPCQLLHHKHTALVVNVTAATAVPEQAKDLRDSADLAVDSMATHAVDEHVVDHDDEDGVAAEENDGAICGVQIYAVKTPSTLTSKLIGRNKRAVPNPNPSQLHSGDVAIAYASLSFAKTFLDQEAPGAEHNWRGDTGSGAVEAMRERVKSLQKVLREPDDEGCLNATHSDASARSVETKGVNATKWTKVVSARVHRSFLDNIGAPSTISSAIAHTMDPALELHYAQHANGDTTLVMEVSGLDHLEVIKHPYVHTATLEHLLQKMSEDLHLSGK